MWLERPPLGQQRGVLHSEHRINIARPAAWSARSRGKRAQPNRASPSHGELLHALAATGDFGSAAES
jgi:hypothetical protein